MNILYIVHRIPYPPNKGDKIRSFHEIKYLAEQHNLYLAFLVDDDRDLEYLPELKNYCVDYDYDLIDTRWQKIKSLPYLFSDKPLSVPYFYSSKLQQAIDRRLNDTRIDAIICFSSPMAEYVFRSRYGRVADAIGIIDKPKLIMDFVDVDSDKWRMYAGFSGFPYSPIYRREWRRLQEYEKKVGEMFDQSVYVSDKEVELFRTFCPNANTFAVPNGVDTDYFTVTDKTDSTDRPDSTVLFMGAMDYYPNEDAVVHFADDIWPLIRREIPDARFVIAGSKPGKRVTELARRGQGIEVTGFVPDMRPYLAKARVFVAPFRIARGIQNKVLEAMAAGVPVVARPEAVQGVSGYDGCIQVESDSEPFARAVVECFRDSDRRSKMILKARESVADRYDWETNLGLLDKLLATS